MQLAPTLPVRDKNDPQYYPELQKAAKRCQDNLQVRENDFKNLMQRYLTLMQQDLYSAKLSQSKIWTFESKFIGTMPLQKESINAAENKKDQEYRLKVVQAPAKDCRAEFTQAEMGKLNLELQNVNNALTESIVKTQAEKSIVESNRMKAQSQTMGEIQEDGKNLMEARQNAGKTKSPGIVIESVKGQ